MKKTAIILVSMLVFGALSCGEKRPSPTDYMQMKEARKDFKKHRKEWIEKMHRVEDGVNYHILDRENRNLKRELGENRSRKGYSEGGVFGHWTERGSNNLAGRMHTADVNIDLGQIYGASSGGNIWRGDIDGTDWICLNNGLQINDIRMVRLLPMGSDYRIFVSGSWPACGYWTDNEGASWNASTGLDDIDSWGWIRKGVVAHDDIRSVYLLGVEWDYVLWRERTALYRSTDNGQSFRKVFTSGLNGRLFDLWTSSGDSTSVFMIGRGDLYRIEGDSVALVSTFEVPSVTAVENVNLAGCYIDDALTLYSAYARSDGKTYVFRTQNLGLEWTERGFIEEMPFLMSGNNFTCSIKNPNLLYFGAVQAYSSYDGGANWEKANDWWEYYDNPDVMLHADIPGIDVFVDRDGNEFALLSTDGGIYISRDSLVTVDNLSLNGLGVSQYYSTYTCRFNPNYIFAGSQDQGFQRCTVDSGGILDFVQLISGDYGHIVSGNEGSSVWTVYCGFAMFYSNAFVSETGPRWDFEGSNYLWMPPLMEHPTERREVYLGGGGSSGGAHIWHLSSGVISMTATELPFDFSEGVEDVQISAMAFSKIDNNYRYVLTSNGSFFSSTDAGANWFKSPAFEGPGAHYFYGSSIIPSPTTLGRVYIAGSGYSNPPAYITEDNGLTFAPFDDGLPNTLVYGLAITPEEEILFAATEIGPYAKALPHGDWVDISGGFAPDQIYWSVEYIPIISTARFGTYGRGIWDFVVDSTAGIKETEQDLPDEIVILVSPNPFNSTTTLEFNIDNPTEGELKIYDLSGRMVKTLYDGAFKPGGKSFVWDGTSSVGVALPSGNYLAILNTGEKMAFKKIVLIK